MVVECVGYNGGFVCVWFVVELWFVLLYQCVDSYNFVNVSVVEISEQIFVYYVCGVIVLVWCWVFVDLVKYVNCSLIVQVGELDFVFFE